MDKFIFFEEVDEAGRWFWGYFMWFDTSLVVKVSILSEPLVFLNIGTKCSTPGIIVRVNAYVQITQSSLKSYYRI